MILSHALLLKQEADQIFSNFRADINYGLWYTVIYLYSNSICKVKTMENKLYCFNFVRKGYTL